MKISPLLLVPLLLLAGQAVAGLNVVATTTNMAMLVEHVGGDRVQVRVLAPPDRDTHYLDVRPNMMAALRRADLVVSVGGELEVGWLPPAIQGAGNPRLNPGRSGYFEAAAQVELIDPKQEADRSMGDVHPAGNPHIYFDPMRMASVAALVASALTELDPAGESLFRANAADFAERVDQRMVHWREMAEDAPGALLFHVDANYLARLLDLPVLGYMEPLPGVPPTARHLRELVRSMEGRDGVLIMQPWHDPRHADLIRRELGWPVVTLPSNVPLGGDLEAYLEMLDRWVAAFAGQSGA